MVSDGPRLVMVFSSGELQGGGFKAKYTFETGTITIYIYIYTNTFFVLLFMKFSNICKRQSVFYLDLSFPS